MTRTQLAPRGHAGLNRGINTLSPLFPYLRGPQWLKLAQAGGPGSPLVKATKLSLLGHRAGWRSEENRSRWARGRFQNRKVK